MSNSARMPPDTLLLLHPLRFIQKRANVLPIEAVNVARRVEVPGITSQADYDMR